MLFLDLSFWEAGIRGLMAMLCQLIYPIMSFLYELFNNVTKINILSQKDIEPIYTRITMILTIIMVFYVTFQFVKYVIQPDGLTDKEKGAGPIIYKMIGVVALIAFVPIIFEKAYDLQNAIIGKNVISQVILGPQATIDEGNMGSSFSSTVFNMFYYVKDENKSASCHDGMDCETLVNYNVGLLKDENRLDSITLGLNETNGTETALINFDGFLAVIVGGFLVYILLLYCIDVGVRWVQLLYLQIISPIPIIGFLSPKKDGIFQKWTKQCLTTYLDLFLRIGIINIVLLLCNELLISKVDSSSELLSGLGELSPMMETLIYVVLIMGVMLFAHKAPKMLGELFPKMGAASGNFGLSGKERYEPTLKALKSGGRFGGALAGTAIGAVVGAGSGLAQGWRRRNSLDKNGQAKGELAGMWGATKGLVGGAIGGAARGLVNGGKKGNVLKNATAGAKNQIKANQRFGNREENGYTLGHQIGDTARGIFGAKSRTQVLEEQKAPLKRKQDVFTQQSKINDQIREYAFKKAGEKGFESHARYTALEGRLKRLQEDKDLIASFGGENDQRYINEITKLRTDMKKEKDKATNEFIDANKKTDGNLINLFKDRDSLIENHNKYDAGNKVSETATIDMKDSTGKTIKVTKAIADMTAEEYDEYIKQIAKTEAGDISRQIGEIDKKQAEIQREIENSGINDGKKS